jgi:hypothetical protein
LRCRHPLTEGESWCPNCAARVRPPWFPRVAYLTLLGVLAITLAFGANRLWKAARAKGDEVAAQNALSRSAPRPKVKGVTAVPTTVGVTVPGATTLPPPLDVGPVAAASITASSFSQPAANGCNQITTYNPERMIDGDNTTAWRADGDGTGQTITITLAGPTRLTQIGLLPGYARTDACTNVDRFPQMRRVAKVRWTFDTGAPVEQSFQDNPAIQFVPVDVTTTKIVIEILATLPGVELDYTPISEIRMLGVTVAATATTSATTRPPSTAPAGATTTTRAAAPTTKPSTKPATKPTVAPGATTTVKPVTTTARPATTRPATTTTVKH